MAIVGFLGNMFFSSYGGAEIDADDADFTTVVLGIQIGEYPKGSKFDSASVSIDYDNPSLFTVDLCLVDDECVENEKTTHHKFDVTAKAISVEDAKKKPQKKRKLEQVCTRCGLRFFEESHLCPDESDGDEA